MNSMSTKPRELSTQLLVVGGGLGGISAALAALRGGTNVILAEERDWLGGQLTSCAVPFDIGLCDDNGIGSRSYSRFREMIRDYYRRNFPLTSQARARVPLNPGMANMSKLCVEPRVAVQAIWEMLAPYQGSGRLRVLTRHKVEAVDQVADHIRSVAFLDLDTGSKLSVTADIVIDATETGELLEFTDIEHVLGAESRSETGELHAIDGPADPFDQQPITWCLAIDYLPEEDHTIDRPPGYETFRELKRDYWPGPQYGWTVSAGFALYEGEVSSRPMTWPLFAGDSDEDSLFDIWHSRRIAHRKSFVPGFYPSDITIINTPQTDYWLKPVVGVSPEEEARALEESRNLALGFLYWMQTEAPRHDDKGVGYPGLRLRGDVLGTSDGLAKQAYYREGRRIKAQFTVLEQHIGVKARPGADRAERFKDSLGIGAYRIDIHATRKRDTVDIDSYPFQIPLGALLPVRVENYLPACKNLGTTRITNGAFRLHPIEWSIGEASGALAAFSLRKGVPPRAVSESGELLEELQGELRATGVPLEWPTFGALTPEFRPV
ncbi:MAG: FAD-dependent oxidoreductase [Rhizobiaceae bacterium]|nr:FAD-dependent oxidoreductase [Rhizobiaceae bacterium]